MWVPPAQSAFISSHLRMNPDLMWMSYEHLCRSRSPPDCRRICCDFIGRTYSLFHGLRHFDRHVSGGLGSISFPPARMGLHCGKRRWRAHGDLYVSVPGSYDDRGRPFQTRRCAKWRNTSARRSAWTFRDIVRRRRQRCAWRDLPRRRRPSRRHGLDRDASLQRATHCAKHCRGLTVTLQARRFRVQLERRKCEMARKTKKSTKKSKRAMKKRAPARRKVAAKPTARKTKRVAKKAKRTTKAKMVRRPKVVEAAPAAPAMPDVVISGT